MKTKFSNRNSRATIYRKMKTVCTIWLVSLTVAVNAADYYVRSDAAELDPPSSGSGLDWNNAWSLLDLDGNWENISGGDTIWLAGGVYRSIDSFLLPTQSGSPGNYIYIKRVRGGDEVPTEADGYKPYFDSQVVIDCDDDGALGFNTSNICYIYIDGRVDMGIQLVCNNNSIVDKGSCMILRAANHLTFTNIDFVGPGSTYLTSSDGSSIGNNPVTMNGNHSGMMIQPPENEYVDDITISHCRLRGHANELFFLRVRNSLVEYCKIYDNAALNYLEWHGNVFYNDGTENITFRYNEIFNWQVEGVFCRGAACSDLFIYGNLWHDGMGANTHRVLEPQTTTQGPVFFYNNTVVNCWGDVRPDSSEQGGGAWATGSIAQNNIFWNISAGHHGAGITLAPNLVGTTGTDPDPFVDYSQQDYHIVSTIGTGYPRNKGKYLGHPYGMDMEGYVRGLGWGIDIGAYEYHPSGGDPEVIAGPIVNPANEHVYYALRQIDMPTAEAQALLLGGHLVTINDSDENTWVLNTFGPHADDTLWIGLNDLVTEGTYTWISGDTSGYATTYRPWMSGEPNNGGGYYANENGVVMAGLTYPTPGAWYDGPTDQTNVAVVEVVPNALPSVTIDSGPTTYSPPGNGHTYFRLSKTLWRIAEAEAIVLGGHLATIDDGNENNWVRTTFDTTDETLWIGLNDIEAEYTRVWADGTPLGTYHPWMTGEPNNGGGYFPNEDAVVMAPGVYPVPGSWYDGPEDQVNPGVVEVVP